MGLFKKKCEYCKVKVDRGSECEQSVKLPGRVGTQPMTFCSEEHASQFESEINEHAKNSKKKGGGGCC